MDVHRNELIAADAIQALKDGRFPLVISDRKDHLEHLSALIDATAKEDPNLTTLRLLRLNGDLSARARAQAMDAVATARERRDPVVIMATASLIGEGFDLPNWIFW